MNNIFYSLLIFLFLLIIAFMVFLHSLRDSADKQKIRQLTQQVQLLQHHVLELQNERDR